MKGETSKVRAERSRRKPFQVVVKDGEPSAVILDIQDYREMLERLDDAEDLKVLERMRRRPLKFRGLEEFLAEYAPRV
ncbi:MAG: type II toxin-antitoxin system prevent-host-death family antitoxin [Dehalococcoidia bacterium]|nr:type II toxin-antitoxin system prevent-host-death family antitoxin [Dehalococcoidia bacterium]